MISWLSIHDQDTIHFLVFNNFWSISPFVHNYASPMQRKITFSNSLIIHHVKTKEFTSMKEVWILMILPLGLLFSFCFDWEGISNTWDSVSSAIQSISNFVKNTLLCVIFSTLFSVFGYPDETLFIKFDILHEKQ